MQKRRFFQEIAETISGTRCNHPRRDGQAEWACSGLDKYWEGRHQSLY